MRRTAPPAPPCPRGGGDGHGRSRPAGRVVWSTADGTFRRSPTGATSLANLWTAVIEALAPDGSLLARVNPYGLGPLEHQLTLPGGTAETLGPAHVTDSGFFANGTAYVIKGGSLYRARP